MKITVFSFLTLVLVTFSVSAQNKKIAISTNVLNLALAGPSLAISYKQSPRLSFQIYGSSGNFNLLPIDQSYNFKTGIIDIKYAFFEYLYVGPYFRYIEKRIQREGYVDNTGFVSISSRDFQGKGLSSGLLLGVTMTDARWLNLEAFAGAGYGKFLSQKDYSHNGTSNGFLDVRVGVLIGLKL